MLLLRLILQIWIQGRSSLYWIYDHILTLGSVRGVTYELLPALKRVASRDISPKHDE
jgi:hypothetical protein